MLDGHGIVNEVDVHGDRVWEPQDTGFWHTVHDDIVGHVPSDGIVVTGQPKAFLHLFVPARIFRRNRIEQSAVRDLHIWT